MSGWRKFFRLGHTTDVFEAKRAEGGEEYGHKIKMYAKKGQWLCRNPDNGHMWVMSDEGFESLYCEVGKTRRPKKQKKQSDGHRKGQSRHSSASSEKSDNRVFGSLFEGRDKPNE